RFVSGKNGSYRIDAGSPDRAVCRAPPACAIYGCRSGSSRQPDAGFRGRFGPGPARPAWPALFCEVRGSHRRLEDSLADVAVASLVDLRAIECECDDFTVIRGREQSRLELAAPKVAWALGATQICVNGIPNAEREQ